MANFNQLVQDLESSIAHSVNAPFFLDSYSLQRYSYKDILVFSKLILENLKLNQNLDQTNTIIIYHSKNQMLCVIVWHICLCYGYTFFPINFKIPSSRLEKYAKLVKATYVITDEIKKNLINNKFKLIPSEQLMLALKDSYPLSSPLNLSNLKYDLSSKTYLLTSGSSGPEKIAVHTHYHHFISAWHSNKLLDYKQESRWLHTLPLFHVSGLSIIYRTFLAKASFVIADYQNIAVVSDYHCTHFSCVPTQLANCIKNINAIPHLKKLACILIGGAPIDLELLKKLKNEKLAIKLTYGCTEMASQIITDNNVLPHCQIKIDKNNVLHVKGASLFLGYFSKKNTPPYYDFEQDGYFKTNDILNYNKNVYQILGRIDRVFISGGENIHPEEIERVLLSHSDILKTIVVPIDHPIWGKRPFCFYQTMNKTPLSEKELKNWLKIQLPTYKIPEYFHHEEIKSKAIKVSYNGYKNKAKLLVQVLMKTK